MTYLMEVVETFWDRSYAFGRRKGERADIFIHRRNVIGRLPKAGDVVSFEKGERQGRPIALNVRVVVTPTGKAVAILSGDGSAK